MTLYEPLRREAFDGTEEPTLLPAIQAEPDLRERLRRLLLSLARRPGRPCAIVLDNLEAIQDSDQPARARGACRQSLVRARDVRAASANAAAVDRPLRPGRPASRGRFPVPGA